MASDVDRLSLTFSLALILHAVLILGVGFAFEITSPKKSMQIILVQEKSDAPKEHDFLAQADLEGGGEEDKKARPTVPLPAPFASEKAVLVATEEEEKTPRHQRSEESAKAAKKRPALAAAPALAPAKRAKSQMSEGQKMARTKKQITALDKSNAPPLPATKINANNRGKPLPPANAVPVGIQSREVATLKAEIALKLEAIAKRPKRTFISASTKKSKYAHYMETWRARVERIGNLNYPKAALAENISGSLVLDVSIRKNGTIGAITLIKPSGHKILDETAEQIVRMAAPFPPFSEEIRQETDILHITRTWEFIDGQSKLY